MFWIYDKLLFFSRLRFLGGILTTGVWGLETWVCVPHWGVNTADLAAVEPANCVFLRMVDCGILPARCEFKL